MQQGAREEDVRVEGAAVRQSEASEQLGIAAGDEEADAHEVVRPVADHGGLEVEEAGEAVGGGVDEAVGGGVDEEVLPHDLVCRGEGLSGVRGSVAGAGWSGICSSQRAGSRPGNG